MKAKIILKSLADLPANALGFATFAPGRAMNASKQMLGATVRVTRREIRAGGGVPPNSRAAFTPGPTCRFKTFRPGNAAA